MKKTITRTSLLVGCCLCWTLINGVAGYGASITAEENLEKLLDTKSCRGCDLTHLNFNRMDLSGTDLEGADLSFSKLFLTNLAGANLQNTTLNGAQFGGADLGDADLRGADLRGTSLESAYLGGALIDGEFITSKPYESIGVPDVEKDVYVEDQSKPKKVPEKQEVRVGTRRDFEEPPPQLKAQDGAVASAPEEAMVDSTAQTEPAPNVVQPQPPAAKTVKPVQAVVVDDPEEEAAPAAPRPVDAIDTGRVAEATKGNGTPAAAESKKQPAAKVGDEAAVVDTPAEAPAESPQSEPVLLARADRVAEKDTVIGKEGGEKSPAVSSDEKPDVAAEPASPPQNGEVVEEGDTQAVEELSGNSAQMNEELALEKRKRDNLTRLLDKNRCYGCDLSGLDLAGEDFEGADLEGANLSGCNLNKADLEDANLKGAKLRDADLRNSDLRDADLYKADLTDADLTGAKMEGAMFDNAVLDGARGVNSQVLNVE
ncbi:MAG: pentapeptide repeat-containing protein [Desulforhopalus sp.]